MGPTIKINNEEYEFETGETILEIARRNGIYIPTLCNLEGTKPTGACRICIVELGKMSAPVASCSTPAAPGMDIQTESPRIRKTRKGIIELLMISGNHNCAAIGNLKSELTDFMEDVSEYDGSESICTAYGECELQSLAYKYMVSNRTLERIPTSYPLEDDDLLIGRDFSRCILCGRCVQACTEVSVNNAISHGYRGNIAKIVARGDKTLPDSECVYCGECLQVCPVGALYEKRSKYDQRLWDVKKENAVCWYCGTGCNLEVNTKDGKIIKIDGLDNGEPNSGQLCFKGRFGFDFLYHDNRVLKPQVKDGSKLKDVSWKEALNRITETIDKYGADSIGCVVSPKYSNEDLFLMKKFIESIAGKGNIAQTEPFSEMTVNYSQICEFDKVVLIDTDIAKENPVAASYVKRANQSGTGIIEISENTTEISKLADEKFKKLSQFKPDGELKYLVFHSPESDISLLADKKNISINSISRENNTIGAYMIGIGNSGYNKMLRKKILFCAGPVNQDDINAEFLVVIDPLPGDLLKKADVVLPPAVWIETDGSYVNGGHYIYRVKNIVNPPGESKSVREIFGELINLSGKEKINVKPDHIWDQMVNKDIDYGDACSFKKLERKTVRIKKGFFKDILSESEGKSYGKFRTHKIYCNHCEGMTNITEKRIQSGE